MGASLNGVFEGMNPYSCFETAYNGEDGDLTGIGANLEKVRDGFMIVSVKPSSPAYKSGLRTGDIIHRIDKLNASAMGIESFRAYINGLDSVLIEYIDRHTGYVRAVKIDTVAYYRKDVDYVILDNAGYIRLNAFSNTTADTVNGILGSVRSLGLTDVILDLRSLASMNIKDASAVAALLSPGGLIARTKEKTYSTRIKETDLNVSILVNEWTAGAGEVIASAVPSVIYGRTTAGKAYHIRQYPLLTEEAYLSYSEMAKSNDIDKILNFIKARKFELGDDEITGYLNIVESGVFNSEGRMITEGIVPDVYVENTTIGYMDFNPGEGMIDIRRDYSYGGRNYDIYLAKKVLKALGYFNGEMTVVFGSDMTAAVNKYKASVGFPADGILDKSTQAMLNTYSMKTAVLDDDCVRAALAGMN
jgi:C-terminal processing protease CtpA/Prc